MTNKKNVVNERVTYRSGANLTMACKGQLNECWVSTQPIKNVVSKGFTLIELLVVVLIIGILAAVAVPQYQKAVMKSRYSSLMPIAKSIANGNEAYYMEYGTYATSPANLDVAGQKNYPDGTKLDVSTGDYSFVIAGRNNNFPMNYLVYQKHSPKFAGHIHCEADENNTMAQEICQSLGGQYIPGSQSEGDYKTYVLSGTVGDNDKLPTSLNKLGKTLCAGKEGCTYTLSDSDGDGVDDTVTTEECGSSTKSMSFNGSYYAVGCENTTYDSEGKNPVKTYTACSMSQYWDAENHNCLKKASADGWVMGENGEIYARTRCSSSNAKGCTSFTRYSCSNAVTNKYFASASDCDGNYTRKDRDCSNGSILNAEFGCSGAAGSGGSDTIIEGNTKTYLQCQYGSVQVDGSCTYSPYSYREITTTDANNNQVVTKQCCPSGFTGMECDGDWVNC